jgi:hypothetical protein
MKLHPHNGTRHSSQVSPQRGWWFLVSLASKYVTHHYQKLQTILIYSLMHSQPTDILKSSQVLRQFKAGFKTDSLMMETKQISDTLVS